VPPAPEWFRKAVATPYETGSVEVKGANVTYQRWGKRGAPGLLLVHGNGAHAHWWDFIAPYFAEEYNVAAITFAGMGDSDFRDSYDMATFAEEEVAVAEAAGLFDGPTKPIIVAHSFGGFVTLVTGAKYGDRFDGMVIVDSPVNPPERPHRGPDRKGRPNRVYPDLASALSRFRLAPPQLCENLYAVDYIARWSLRKADEGGWTWKFDPMIWKTFRSRQGPRRLASGRALPGRDHPGRDQLTDAGRCARIYAEVARLSGSVHFHSACRSSCHVGPAHRLHRRAAHHAGGVEPLRSSPGRLLRRRRSLRHEPAGGAQPLNDPER
jgi:pimeloyl-ACP methyl ester carboxylesterase